MVVLSGDMMTMPGLPKIPARWLTTSDKARAGTAGVRWQPRPGRGVSRERLLLHDADRCVAGLVRA